MTYILPLQIKEKAKNKKNKQKKKKECERVEGWGASDAVPPSRDGTGCHPVAHHGTHSGMIAGTHWHTYKSVASA